MSGATEARREAAPTPGPPGDARRAGPFRWWVLGVTSFGAAVFAALRMGLPSLGPAIREEFGLSLPQVGVVLAAIGAGTVITLVPWGMLADRCGERLVLSLGLLGTAGALVLTALAPGYTTLVLGILLAGAIGAATIGASGRAVMGWFAWRERGTALGIRQMALPLGGALGSVVLPAVAIAHGVDAAFLVLAAALVVAAVVCAAVVREPPHDPAAPPAAEGVHPFRDPRVLRLSVGSALQCLPQTAALGFIALYLVDEHGLGQGQAALVLALVQVLGAYGRFRAGRVSDRLGRRIVPMRRRAVTATAGLLGTAALTGAALWVIAPVLVATCVATMTWNGLSFTAAAEISGFARAGTAMAVQNTVVGLGTVAGPPLFGAIVELSSYPVAFALFAVFPATAWVVLRPLVGDEDERAAHHEQRLKDHAAASAAVPD